MDRPASPIDSDSEWESPSERIVELQNQLLLERNIALGASELLRILTLESDETKDKLRRGVEEELIAAENRIEILQEQLKELEERASPEFHRRPTLGSIRAGIGMEWSMSGTTDKGSFRPNDIMDLDSESLAIALERVKGLLDKLLIQTESRGKIRVMDSIVESLFAEERVKFELQFQEILLRITCFLSEAAGTDVRAAIYRLLRHLILDSDDLIELESIHFDLYLIKSLSRDSKFEIEKDQVLKLLRVILSLSQSSQSISVGVVRGIISIAENHEEKLRLSCLEFLGELVIRDLPLLVQAEGLRVVLQALSDGPHELSAHLSMVFLHVMDKPETRQYLKPGLDIEVILSAFTESSVRGHADEERIKASAKMISIFLKSWSGLIYLNCHNRQAIAALIDSLKSPSRTVRDALIDTMFDIFQIKTPAWFKSSAQARSSTSQSTPTGKSNLIDQYLAILLLIFIDAGLLETLAIVAEEPRDLISSRKVSVLIGELLQLSNRVLPLSYATKVQALPRLFSLASSFEGEGAIGRLAASNTLSVVDSLNRCRSRVHLAPNEEFRNRGQRQVETSKIKLAMSIDDSTFRNLLLATALLTTKDFTKWNFEILLDLIEGPLLNSNRLDEAMRASKFMKRLLSFFLPFNYRFSQLSRNEMNEKYITLGCALITTLLSNPDGVTYLSESKLLPQISECLFQLDISRNSTSNMMFSLSRVEKTLTGGYFEILGVLTGSPDGLKLLEAHRIFTAFYKVGATHRLDLIKEIVQNVDYASDGHSRVFLSRALTSNSKQIRLFATEFLTKLTQESPTPQEWQIRLLLTQLYDISSQVCELVVKFLEIACTKMNFLEIVVQMRPSLDHLGDVGSVLLTRFLSTDIGLRYLHEIDFIEREMEDWFHERNFTYMVHVELLLASVLGITDTDDDHPSDSTPPPHFYGELVKTAEGCDILEGSGHFAEFATFIRQHGLEEYDSIIIGKLKSVLWAVGQVGASTGGLSFLEGEYIVQSIVEIAEDSPVYSVRGTAYFVLGLIASTLEGVEILEELGWESVYSALGNAIGISVPLELDNFVLTLPWDTPQFTFPELLSLSPPTSTLEKEAITYFANLSNHILATKASKSLTTLKSRHAQVFTSPGLYNRVLEMLSTHHYRLPVRRYMIELFDLDMSKDAEVIVQAGKDMHIEGVVGEESERFVARKTQMVEETLPSELLLPSSITTGFEL